MTKNCPIRFAKSYPFDIPDSSYVLDKNGWNALPVGGHERDGRHAVIASGSNASPVQLARKYQNHDHLLDQPVYVTRAILCDFDAVYSAHFSSYGSIPATLAHAPGAQSRVFVTWLTDAQLERMHETEAVGVNYDYTRLHGIDLTIEDGMTLDTAHAYLSRRGCLNRDGKPVPLAELDTQGRKWTPMNQCEVLDYARTLIAPHEEPEAFIEAGIKSPALRMKRAEKLAETALQHGWKSLIFLS
ncbi:hypothetical protein [Magnetovibrio sp.]|uniref:hypothetical protein n=1 Tax=Magnetovibrio sp. TaxID=2024836 RepID=UPI002F93F8B3